MDGNNKTWSKLDLEEIQRNYDVLKKAEENGMEIMSLEPANVYTFEPTAGSPVRDLCPRYLSVAKIEEGVELRQRGVTLPILVREFPQPDNIVKYVKTLHFNYLAQSVGSIEETRALASRVIPAFGGVLSIHIKVDIAKTGEGFTYFDEKSRIEDFISAKTNLGMYFEGIYTELKKDEPDSVKEMKIQRLGELAERIEKETKKPFKIRHFFCE